VDTEFRIDVAPLQAALTDAGLMPPVVGLEVQGSPGGGDEVLIVTVLTSSADGVGKEIARALANVRFEVVYVGEDAPRPNVDYIATPEELL
jgi:hypothetical protein